MHMIFLKIGLLSLLFAAMGISMAAEVGVPSALAFCGMQTPTKGLGPVQSGQNFNTKSFAVRKEDGGQLGVSASEGIRCEVGLIEKNGKLIVHASAKIVTISVSAKDADGVYLSPPQELVRQWETDIDMTNRNVAEFAPAELPDTKIIVSLQRLTK